MNEPIYRQLEDATRRGWDAFTDHLHHGHYHDPEAAATPATEAPIMSLVSTLETDFEDVRAKVEEFAKDKLPAGLADAKKLAGNPVVDALLSAVHVPAEALSMVVGVIGKLEELYAPESDSQAPAAPSDPAVPVQAEPQPEPAPASA